MDEQTLHALLTVAIASAVTIALRAIPFLLFGKGRQTPAIVEYLGKVLPYAIIGMLVVYCLKDVQPLTFPYGIPELLGCAIVAALHVWKRNSLLSIGLGSLCYMLMVQFIFK
jgi:branched-subunit amino acid transport protein AzlD